MSYNQMTGWKKGESGNPGGLTREEREWLKNERLHNWETWKEIRDDKKKSPLARIVSAEKLDQRDLGKPVNPISGVDANGDIVPLKVSFGVDIINEPDKVSEDTECNK